MSPLLQRYTPYVHSPPYYKSAPVRRRGERGWFIAKLIISLALLPSSHAVESVLYDFTVALGQYTRRFHLCTGERAVVTSGFVWERWCEVVGGLTCLHVVDKSLRAHVVRTQSDCEQEKTA